MNILIIGATSAIARSVSRLYAAENMRLCLLGKDEKRLSEAAADLRLRGAGAVETLTYNAEKTNEHSTVIDSAIEFLGNIDSWLSMMLFVRLLSFCSNVSPIHKIGSASLDKTVFNFSAMMSLFSSYTNLLSEWPTIHESILIELIDVDPV